MALVIPIVVALWTLVFAIHRAKAEENRASADRPHSNDVPAVGWVLIAAGTFGLPIFVALHDTGKPSDDAPTWFVLTASAVFGFFLSAVAVFAGTAIVRAVMRPQADASGDSDNSSVPKPVSLWQRVVAFTLSGLLLAYGIHGLWVDDLYIPPGRGAQIRQGTHLHGVSAAIVFVGWLVTTLGILMPLVGRGNSANRGITYRKYARIGVFVGLGLMVLGVFWK